MKLFISLFSLLATFVLCTTNAFAQSTAIVGDMNNDGELSIEDITLLTETILGNKAQQTIIVVPIERTPVSRPVSKSYTYTGNEITFIDESESYTILGTNKATNAGTYTVNVSLNNGYVWADDDSDDSNNSTEDLQLYFQITKKEIRDITCSITGTLSIGNELKMTGVPSYVKSDDVTYTWFRYKNNDESDKEQIASNKTGTYEITKDDEGCYIKCVMNIKDSGNYTSFEGFARTDIINISKIDTSITIGELNPNYYVGETISPTFTITPPNAPVVYTWYRTDTKDASLTAANQIDVPVNTTTYTLTGADEGKYITVKAVVSGNNIYNGSSAIMTTDNAVQKQAPKIYWGMYPYWNYSDKEDRLMPIFLNGQLPDKKVEVASDATTFTLSRALYDAATGNTETVRCWWIAAPAGTKFKSALESGVNPFVVSEHQISSTNTDITYDSDKVDLDITIDGVKYEVYGSLSGTKLGAAIKEGYWDLVVNL